jgi:hypothetical protein
MSDADFTIATLAPPTELTIYPSGTDLSLMWQSVVGADGYYVYKSVTSSESGFDFLASTASTNYIDIGGSASQPKSFYRIEAFRGVELRAQPIHAGN